MGERYDIAIVHAASGRIVRIIEAGVRMRSESDWIDAVSMQQHHTNELRERGDEAHVAEIVKAGEHQVGDVMPQAAGVR